MTAVQIFTGYHSGILLCYFGGQYVKSLTKNYRTELPKPCRKKSPRMKWRADAGSLANSCCSVESLLCSLVQD